MKNGMKMTSVGLLMSLTLVGCSPMMDVETLGDGFLELTEEEQIEFIEDYAAPVIEKLMTEALEEAIIVEEPNVHSDEVLNELVQGITWTIERGEFGDATATGILENTTDKTIDYIEIEYKFKKDGITVDSSWTNAINIAPGEKVQIEIYTYEDFDSLEVKGSDGF